MQLHSVGYEVDFANLNEIKSLIFTDNYLENYRGLEVGGVIRKILYLAGWKLKKIDGKNLENHHGRSVVVKI